MSYTNEEMSQILGTAVLERLNTEGMQITWKPQKEKSLMQINTEEQGKHADWLKVFIEYSADLQNQEFLVVGERDGKAFKMVKAFGNDAKILEVVGFINKAIKEYL